MKEKKPADEPELGSTGETVYHAILQLPAGWSMTLPKDVDLKEDWLAYHAKYSFKDGTYTTERSLRVEKTKIPLAEWEKFLTLRRVMFEDWNRQTLIAPHGQEISQDWMRWFGGAITQNIGPGQEPATLSSETINKMRTAMQSLHDAVVILAADPPASAEDLAKVADLARKEVDAIEASTLSLNDADPLSLHWAKLLPFAWTVRGWAALETKDLATAESYLRAAWKLSEGQMSGYLFGQELETKGEKAAAAHQYELARIATSNYLDSSFYTGYNVKDRIADSYQKLTGKPMTATPLNNGQYKGSLSAELDKETEIRSFTPTSKYTGEVFFTVAYEAGKPVKARLLQGDKKFAPLAATLEARKLGAHLPAGSKARLLREVRLMCSEYGGGCDAYLLLPTAIQIPAKDIKPPNAPEGTKVIQIENLPHR